MLPQVKVPDRVFLLRVVLDREPVLGQFAVVPDKP